jgi:hypothetical protein
VGNLFSVRGTTLYIQHDNQSTQFVSLPQFLKVRSQQGFNFWSFEAEKDDLRVRGRVEAENREFITGTEEDTDGSYLHLATAPMASMELLIFRREKLELHAFSDHAVTLELASPDRNPYLAGLPGSN